MLPPASHSASLTGYDHLDPDDRPHIGQYGITDEQRLWYHFTLENVIRKLHRFRTDQQRATYLSDQFTRLESLPVDR